MTKKTNKTEQLGFLLMWHADWREELHKENTDFKQLCFYAAMAEEAAMLAGCYEVLGPALKKCAKEYRKQRRAA
jgi:hypothetical protein